MLHGLELSLQGSGRKHFSVSSFEYAKYIGCFSCFPSKHEATVEGRVELVWFVLAVVGLC